MDLSWRESKALTLLQLRHCLASISPHLGPCPWFPPPPSLFPLHLLPPPDSVLSCLPVSTSRESFGAQVGLDYQIDRPNVWLGHLQSKGTPRKWFQENSFFTALENIQAIIMGGKNCRLLLDFLIIFWFVNLISVRRNGIN